MDVFVFTLEILQFVLGIAMIYWWIWLPLFLFFAFWSTLESLNRSQFLSGLKWVLLELRVPRETRHSPKAMEQVFLAFHSMPGVPKAPKTWKEKFNAIRDRVIKGKVPEWFAMEVVGTGGEIHLYIRVLEQHRNMIESQIYAYYPEAEVTQVPDYMSSLPLSLPNDEFDVTGSELELNKEDAYPIRTYVDFEEEKGGKDDAVRIDPMAPLAETLSTLNIGEYIGIQILLRATDDSWVKKGQAVIDKIFEKPEKPKTNLAERALTGIENIVRSMIGATVEKKEEKKEGKTFSQLNPGNQDVVKSIERSFSKLGFQTGIRVLYTARRDRFNGSRMGAIFAALRVFSSQALNGFKGGFSPEVKKGFNKEQKTLENKVHLFGQYRNRAFPKKTFVLNTEELATIYHFPDVEVKTPAVPRIEAKKGEPPSVLPVV